MQKNVEIQINPQKIKMQERLKNITTEAQDYFAEKSLAEEFYGLRLFCLYALLPLSLLSMLNAIGLFILPTQSWGSFVLMLTIALLLVGLIEWAKTYSFIKAMKQFYTRGFTGFFVFFSLVFVAGLALSVYTSIQGAQELVRNFDSAQVRQDLKTDSLKTHHRNTSGQAQAQAEKAHATHIANLKADYTRRIQAEQQGLQEYKNSVTWEGKINIHNPANAYNLNAYQERITSLQKQLTKELDAATLAYQQNTRKIGETEKETLTTLAQKHREASTQNARNQSFSVWFWAIVSGANEVLILFCAWFLIHYKYLAQHEPKALGLKVGIFKHLENFIFMYDLQGAPLPPTQDLQELRQDLPNHLPKNKLGFDVGRQDFDKDLPKSYRKSYAKSYKDLPDTLEEAIRQGFTHTPSLTARYGVSINQVHEARKTIEHPAPTKPKESLIIKPDLFTSEKGGAR